MCHLHRMVCVISCMVYMFNTPHPVGIVLWCNVYSPVGIICIVLWCNMYISVGIICTVILA